MDLALLDVMMPRMDGWELARKIRGASNIPSIFLSARDQDYDRIMGLQLGADDYLTKPFPPMEAVARVQSNLRRFYELGAADTRSCLLSTSPMKNHFDFKDLMGDLYGIAKGVERI